MVSTLQAERLPPRHAAADHATVLIIDDSVVMRAVLARIVDASGRFAVVGAVPNAATAIAYLEKTPVDLILLDLEMPGVSGIAALPDLIAVGGDARILVVSSSAAEGAEVCVRALALGAADTMPKPDSRTPSRVFAEALIDKLDRLASRAPAIPAPLPLPVVPQRTAAAPLPASGPAAYDVVAIGASTGGIHALGELLRELPATFRLPILVTQHLPATFMPFFAAQVALLADRPCDVATDRLRLRPGRVIVAPGDAHIRLVPLGDGGAAIRLSSEPAASGCMPSVDPMFDSLAEVFGPRGLAVVLSGMGRDGAEGARRVHTAGGTVVVQDQASSVVWGMPGAVATAGIADAVLPPAAIGSLIASRQRA